MSEYSFLPHGQVWTFCKDGSVLVTLPGPFSQLPYNGPFVGNTLSKLYHHPDCYSLPIQHHKVHLETEEEAEAKGFIPCGRCCRYIVRQVEKAAKEE